MPAANGALRMIESAAIRLCADLDPWIMELDNAVMTAGGKSLPRSARAISARLKLLLAASMPAETALPLAGLTELAEGMPPSVCLEVGSLHHPGDIDAPLVRVLLNLLLLAADSLPSGGVIRLAGRAGDILIQITGPGAAWPDGTALCLARPEEASHALECWDAPRAALAAALAHEAGIRLSAIYPTTGGPAPAILRIGGA